MRRHFLSPDMWEGIVEEMKKWTDPGISLTFNSGAKSALQSFRPQLLHL